MPIWCFTNGFVQRLMIMLLIVFYWCDSRLGFHIWKHRGTIVFEKLIGLLLNMENCWIVILKIQNTMTTSKIWMQMAKVGVQDFPPTRTFLLRLNNHLHLDLFCNYILWNDVTSWSFKFCWKYIINFLWVHVKYCVCKILKQMLIFNPNKWWKT